MTPLRKRMLEDMRIRNLSVNTQLSYQQQIAAFANHYQLSPRSSDSSRYAPGSCTCSRYANLPPAVWRSPLRRFASSTRSPSSATGPWRSYPCPRSRSSCR